MKSYNYKSLDNSKTISNTNSKFQRFNTKSVHERLFTNTKKIASDHNRKNEKPNLQLAPNFFHPTK